MNAHPNCIPIDLQADERVPGTHCPACGQKHGVVAFRLDGWAHYKCPDCGGWGKWIEKDGTVSYKKPTETCPHPQ